MEKRASIESREQKKLRQSQEGAVAAAEYAAASEAAIARMARLRAQRLAKGPDFSPQLARDADVAAKKSPRRKIQKVQKVLIARPYG
jgi:hypothetical protein